jgi:hypothetical protein
MKIGRNDSCPCGSGKKYKKCCLKQAEDTGDLLWRQLRSIHDEMAEALLGHSKKVFGPEALEDAWDEFWLWENEVAFEEGPEIQLFVPFFLYNWLPDVDSETYEIAPRDTTVGFDFLQKKRGALSPLERNFLDQNLEEPFSFWEIIAVTQGEGYRLRDIFLGVERDVIEKSGSRSAQVGDILYAKVIQIEHVGMVCGCGWILIPPIHKKAILDFRKKLQKTKAVKVGGITQETLHDYNLELRELFLYLHDMATAPPQLHNTDGDPIALHKITYEIESAQVAFDAMASLSLLQTREELLQDAEYHLDEKIRKIEFAWYKRGNKLHKDWDNTVMGHLSLDDKIMTIEVNSKKRANLIKKEVKTRLKDKAKHRSTVLQSPEAIMARQKTPGDEAAEKKQEELMSLPEVQEQLRQHAKRHWENWYKEKIPALGNKTPIQAAKNAEGRELLEALLNHYSRMESKDALYEPDWNEVRTRLGLLPVGEHP